MEEEEDEEEDDIIYNPKNLPLGWDGKPIPYWLYKLHGLNIDYKCQICGNQVRPTYRKFVNLQYDYRLIVGPRRFNVTFLSGDTRTG